MNTHHDPEHVARPRLYAAARTALAFAVVGLAWLALASFLPNFHLSSTTVSARMTFVGILLALMALILLAQLTMLRAWFRSLLLQRPDRQGGIGRLRVAVFAMVLVGVLIGVMVLWYATIHWMPQVQDAVQGSNGAR